MIDWRETVEFVGKGIEPDGDWMPTLLVEKQGQVIVFGLDGDFMSSDDMKDVCARLITKLIVETAPEAVCFVTTAWAVTSEKEGDLKRGDCYIRPSQDPRRKEIVMMFGYSPAEGEKHQMGLIERRATEHPIISEWKDMPNETKSQGRFAEAIYDGFAKIGGEQHEAGS